MRSSTHQISLWRRLLEPACADLVSAAADIDPGDVAAVSRLRKRHEAALVNLALDLAAARRKLARKWPDRAPALIADPSGAEMASSALAARHKTARLRDILPPPRCLIDLCCGIGGDAMAFAEDGMLVLGVDADPVRAWMCERNAGCATFVADALDEQLPPAPFHLDPARREASSGPTRRLFALDDLQPGPAAWRSLIQSRGSGAIKLGPGIDARELTAALPPDSPCELEWLSERGTLTQCVAWLGQFARAPGKHTATMLTEAASYTFTAAPGPPPPAARPVARYLIEADPAVERAELLGELARRHGFSEIAPGLGLLTCDHEPPALSGPFCDWFEVLHHAPWIEKHLREWLHAHDAGIVEVKTRAQVINPDSLQAALRGKGSTTYTLFVLRVGRSIESIVARRMRSA